MLVRGLFVLAGVALLAYWAQILSAPRPVAALPSDPQANNVSLPADIAIGNIFNIRTGNVASSIAGLSLTGVFAAESGNSGFAAFRSNQGSLVVEVGDEVRPGLTLTRIDSQGVYLLGNGKEQRLEIVQSTSTTPSKNPAERPK